MCGNLEQNKGEVFLEYKNAILAFLDFISVFRERVAITAFINTIEDDLELIVEQYECYLYGKNFEYFTELFDTGEIQNELEHLFRIFQCATESIVSFSSLYRMSEWQYKNMREKIEAWFDANDRY